MQTVCSSERSLPKYQKTQRHNLDSIMRKFTQKNMMPMWTGIIYADLYFNFCIIKSIQIISKISVHISQKTRKFSIKNATN